MFQFFCLLSVFVFFFLVFECEPLLFSVRFDNLCTLLSIEGYQFNVNSAIHFGNQFRRQNGPVPKCTQWNSKLRDRHRIERKRQITALIFACGFIPIGVFFFLFRYVLHPDWCVLDFNELVFFFVFFVCSSLSFSLQQCKINLAMHEWNLSDRDCVR